MFDRVATRHVHWDDSYAISPLTRCSFDSEPMSHRFCSSGRTPWRNRPAERRAEFHAERALLSGQFAPSRNHLDLDRPIPMRRGEITKRCTCERSLSSPAAHPEHTQEETRKDYLDPQSQRHESRDDDPECNLWVERTEMMITPVT